MQSDHTYRGFTFVELMVVIAIIGVLAAIILTSIRLSQRRAADVAIKDYFNSVIIESNLVNDKYVALNNYTGFCSEKGVVRLFTAANDAAGGGGWCASDTWSWTMYVPLKEPPAGTKGWCLNNATLVPFAVDPDYNSIGCTKRIVVIPGP